jgi:hypothetical protein
MSAVWYHFRRYALWALFGALLMVSGPVILELAGTGFRFFWDRILLYGLAIGGLLLVIPRALLGLVTGWRPGVADQAMAVGVGRFFGGWLAGLGAAWLLLLFWPNLSSGRLASGERSMPIFIWDRFIPACMVTGGLAGILAGGLVRRRTRWLLPPAWIVVFAALLSCWLFANDFLLHQFQRLFRALKLPI